MEEGLDDFELLSSSVEDYGEDCIEDIYNEETMGVNFEKDKENQNEEKSTDEIQKILMRYYKEFESEYMHSAASKDPEKQLDNLFFEFCKFVLYYFHFNTPDIPVGSDTDIQLKHKSYHLYFTEKYMQFKGQFELIQNDIIEKVRADIYDRVYKDDEHPLLKTFDHVLFHQEMHCRRIKASPCKTRIKMDVGTKPNEEYNVVDAKRCFFGDQPSEKKWLIFVPLPTDNNSDAYDPFEGNIDYNLAVEVDKINNNFDHLEMFGAIVSPNWSDLLCFVHSVRYFEEYVRSHLLDPLLRLDMDHIVTWDELWVHLTKDYAEKRITRFSRNKGKPEVVVLITEMRDLLRSICKFYHTNVK